MLVLSRKVSQSIQIGSDIRIIVVKVDRHSVRLGIEAPADVAIMREELLLEFDEEDDDACPPAPAPLAAV